MIRILSILVGLFFTVALAWSLLLGGIALSHDGLPHTVESAFHKHPKEVEFASDGAFGKFDNQQLQRGLKVYQEVCAACHSLRHVAFRDLKALGYNDDEVKAIAAKAQPVGAKLAALRRIAGNCMAYLKLVRGAFAPAEIRLRLCTARQRLS